MNPVIEKSWIDGCSLSRISGNDLLALMDRGVADGEKGRYITSVNVSKLVMMQRDRKLAEVILNSSANLADGYPLYLATRLVGEPIPERITGVDFMEALLGLAGIRGYSVYFLGSRPEVLKKVLEKCRSDHPNIKVAGSRHGYFSPDEEGGVVAEVAGAAPDILLVAMGVPQKEYFVADHVGELNAGITLPVGGAFDVYAGTKKRAPELIQKMGVEWLWRSLYDPSRAAMILKSFFPFIMIVLNDIYRKRLLEKKGL